jgi:predicted ATPase
MSAIGRMGTDKKIGLNLEMNDFGPIIEGKISLKPLTLFIGPNNSGKSYAAMLIHSIYETYAPTISLIDVLPHVPRNRFLFRDLGLHTIQKNFDDEQAALREQISSLEDGEELEIPKPLLDKITAKIFDKLYEQRLSEEILRSYASPLNDLIRIGKKSFELKIDFDSDDVYIACEKKQLKIKKYPESDIKIKVAVFEDSIIFTTSENEIGGRIIAVNRGWRVDENLSFMDTIVEICCASNTFKKAAIPCYYLPAGRSGILQGRKLLTRSIVDDYSLAGIEKFPTFAGVVSKFLTFVTDMPEREGTCYTLAREFEDELIRGEITVRRSGEYRYPEIRYNYHDVEIPLHRASSTVSELAPVFLYLKYIIEPGSILIIEEPEAHLHPANQRILAKYLVRLIRNGVYVLITTHSEYLLEQLSNFILLGKIEPEKRVEKYGYDKDDYLERDELAAYVFNLDRTKIGSRIAEVEITEEDGISQEEFLKVHEVLYDEILRLERDLDVDM